MTPSCLVVILLECINLFAFVMVKSLWFLQHVNWLLEQNWTELCLEFLIKVNMYPVLLTPRATPHISTIGVPWHVVKFALQFFQNKPGPSTWKCRLPDIAVFKTILKLTLPVTWYTNSLTFNNCTFCPHCIYVFCVYLRTNSDLCHLQHKLIGFYNRDEKCLLRGTNWAFN